MAYADDSILATRFMSIYDIINILRVDTMHVEVHIPSHSKPIWFPHEEAS